MVSVVAVVHSCDVVVSWFNASFIGQPLVASEGEAEQASADPRTGELKGNPEGGIEKIPDFVENPNREGYGWTYADWGENRAHLEPVDVTGAKPEERDNNSYYLHDSEKGYTRGCTEVEGDLFNKLKEYREAGNEKIDVIVQYPNGEHSTNGGTEKSKTVE